MKAESISNENMKASALNGMKESGMAVAKRKLIMAKSKHQETININSKSRKHGVALKEKRSNKRGINVATMRHGGYRNVAPAAHQKASSKHHGSAA